MTSGLDKHTGVLFSSSSLSISSGGGRGEGAAVDSPEDRNGGRLKEGEGEMVLLSRDAVESTLGGGLGGPCSL